MSQCGPTPAHELEDTQSSGTLGVIDPLQEASLNPTTIRREVHLGAPMASGVEFYHCLFHTKISWPI